MKIVEVRGSVVAAVATIFVLGMGVTAPAHAQQTAALAANLELAAKGVWDETVTYAKEDIVTARGSTWISLRANNKNRVPGQTQPSTAIYWQLFARGFNPFGAWVNSTKYQPDDLVTHQGQTFRAKVTNTNRQPPHAASWELFAAKGAAGPNTGIGNGSQLAPSISFTGDADTGIFSPAAGKIAMAENGALMLHTLGTANTALGRSALDSSTTGFGNTALGSSALTANTTGSFNTALGYLALTANTTGGFNTAVGRAALDKNTTGDSNIAVGYVALTANTTGNNNTAVGQSALGSNTNGTNNIAVGVIAGANPTNPNNSIFIGNSGAGADTTTIKIGTQSTQTTTFIAGIHGATSASGIGVFVNSSGQLGTATSSRRYKDDIEPIANAGTVLAMLRPVSFRYKQADADGSKPKQYGLIAEEVEQVVPDLAAYNPDGTIETVRYQFLSPLLLAGYQAQQKMIATQEQKIEALEDRLRRLEALLPQAKAAALQ